MFRRLGADNKFAWFLGETAIFTVGGGTWTYDVYGNITAHTGTATTTYAGEYQDTDTGLTYLRARDYDPTTGTFLTRNPLENVTITPYAYTDGNPLQDVDPTGMFSVDGFVKAHWRGIAQVAVGIGIVGGACMSGTMGLCAGLSPLLATLAVAAIGTLGGSASYALDDTCHTVGGYAENMLYGASTTLAGEAAGYGLRTVLGSTLAKNAVASGLRSADEAGIDWQAARRI